MISSFFDEYNLKARLWPALLPLSPLFVTVAIWTPAFYKMATGLVSIALACGVISVFVHISRSLGRSTQTQLIKEWGGLPTTLWLRHSDLNVDEQTKRRYHGFLQSKIDHWQAPTKQEELSNAAKADEHYSSAIKWLLEYTRDTKKYELLFKENISYGFRRNTLGIKPIGIAISFLLLGFGSFWIHGETLSEIYANIPKLSTIAIDCFFFLWWVLAVNSHWVKDAANAYARALLAACENTSP